MDADDDNAEPALEDLDLPDRPDETAPTVRRGDDTAGGSSTAGTSGTRAPDPGPVAPLTVADLRPRPAEGRTPDGRPGWALLVVLGILAAVLVAVVVHADLGRVADPGWQDNALWAAGAAVVLLGAALAAVAWTVSTPRSGSTLARSAVLAAVFGVVAAVVVVGLADDRGGEIARSSVAASVPSASTATTVPQEPVLGVEDALDPQYLAPSSLPIDVRTTVTLELTRIGDELLARAMGCRPGDVRNNAVVGSAIGGTWAQPLLVVSPPFDAEGDAVGRCRRVIIRLPIAAGVVRPGI